MNPPFCPNPACPNHDPVVVASLPVSFFKPISPHQTKVVGPVPRYRCCTCNKSFSDRTFSLDYWTKKSINYKEILRSFAASESLSRIADNLDCSTDSLQNRLERLGRNAIALQSFSLYGMKLQEDLAADGFESFDRSQFFPNNINILVGAESQFLYGFTFTSLRRKGRMTAAQKRRRAVYDKIAELPRAGVKKSFSRLVANLSELWDPSVKPQLCLRTDEHPAYHFVLKRNASICNAMKEGRFIHQTYSSKLARTPANPLFPVNYYDRELRKDIAAFHRESTCFTRNVSNGLLRLATYVAWHNYRKDFRIKNTEFEGISHAAKAGLNETVIEERLRTFFSERVFISHLKLTQDQRDIWLKKTPTPLNRRPDRVAKYVSRGG